ncbi:excalibur calcium-binding domain-containing protein [Pseudonocardia oceani]|uniref:Excalibur calcium-binding domain-containing protein n=2 Tax=Pseudonocardia oceani TaxID=2792013 RepID=A0ABS6UBN0_9PSEU|nr:excalibur calcium-binding domain-containing protein [Pseudonocardia oceani]
MSERYASHVHEVLRERGRPACVAVVVPGRRGIEVEVHLPEVARATEALPVTPPPAPPAGAGAWPPPGGSGGWPAPAPAGGGWPGNRPGPGSPYPAPDGRGPGRGPGGRGPGRARRSRRPLWVGAGVLAALVVIGSTMSNHSGEVPTVSAAAPSTTRSAPTPTTVPVPPAPTTVPAPTVVEEVEQVDVAVPDVDAPEVAPQAAARVPETRRTRESAPEPEPEPERQVVEEPEAAYYPNCSAVRAAGADPIRAGDPGYSFDLDRDRDGIACE